MVSCFFLNLCCSSNCIPFVISNVVYFCLASVFLVNLARGLSILFIFSKNQAGHLTSLSYVALYFPRFSFSCYCFLPSSLCFFCFLYTTQGWKIIYISLSYFLLSGHCPYFTFIMLFFDQWLSFYIMCFFNLWTTSFFCCSFIYNILHSAWLIIVAQWICAEWVNV